MLGRESPANTEGKDGPTVTKQEPSRRAARLSAKPALTNLDLIGGKHLRKELDCRLTKVPSGGRTISKKLERKVLPQLRMGTLKP